ncbi:MotE family protein [Fredinandcohnia sp. 179-A 10B2 NHS]|uniref:MotE family protein n=1 Tax=Fredinandcohnia sp. 179-A 10B2 NHS TaxID=3235176 RepID=UPI0039A0AB9C
METTEKEYNKLQWFLFVVLIPTLFTLLVVVVLLSVAGFNPIGTIKEYAEKTPLLSNLFDKKGSDIQTDTENLKVTIGKLETEINTKQDEITKLENELDTKVDEIKTLQQEIEVLSNEIVALQEEKLTKTKTNEEMKQLYELMSPKNAALIIPKLNELEAKDILSSLETETLAEILEKMSPEDAARYTELLTK